ncbi:MAG: hypothetical protein QXK88_02820 [Desulfurococcaceae archaeon]
MNAEANFYKRNFISFVLRLLNLIEDPLRTKASIGEKSLNTPSLLKEKNKQRVDLKIFNKHGALNASRADRWIRCIALGAHCLGFKGVAPLPIDPPSLI